jgi:hypothetical protein
MIVVPLWVALAILAVGFTLWLVDQPRRARERRRKREAGEQLAADLNAPGRSTRLPYGFSHDTTPDEFDTVNPDT